jgi:hypothetical protein
MKTLVTFLIHPLVQYFKRSHALTLRRSRIHYRNRNRRNLPAHTQLNFESILK